MVEERALLEVGVVGVRLQREEAPGELEHVVDVARLAVRPSTRSLSSSGGPKYSSGAVAAGGEAVVLRHLVPEEGSRP